MPWIAAGAALGGAAISGGLNYFGQSSANEANAQLARTQMDFQREMDSTKYQRAVKDLQAAGLNPMMAYGSMATNAPSGSLGIAQQNTMSGAAEAIRGAASDFSSHSMKLAQARNMEEQNKQIQVNTAKTAEETKKVAQDTQTSATQALVNTEQLKVQKAQAAAATASAVRDLQQAKSTADQRARDAATAPAWSIAEDVSNWFRRKVDSWQENSAKSRGFGRKE